MATVEKQIVFAAVKQGGSIVLRGPKNADAIEFFQTLPLSRWNPQVMAWTCAAEPSAAWRLLNQCPVPVEPADDVIDLAVDFADSLHGGGSDEQPAVRRNDSWRHQVAAYHFANGKRGAMLALGMGCGKSKVTVDLIVNRNAKQAIILCPVSVLPVWRREFDRHAGSPVDVLILDSGTCETKARKAEQFMARCRATGAPAAAVVVNYESAWRDPLAKWILGYNWCVAVCDESHRIKSHDANVSKFAAKLALVSEFRLALTGTPMPHSPLDLFSQFRFIDRGLFGTWFHHFRNRYAKLNAMFPGKVDAWLNQEELKERFALLSYRVTADEVLDLPEASHHERRCTLSPKAMKIYRSLEQDLIADVGSGVVTATNALTRLLRLQQATSGFVVPDDSDGAAEEIDVAKGVLLDDIIEDIGPGEPLVVFCRFRRDIDFARRVAERHGRRFGELSGASKDGLDDMGCMAAGVDVLGVQIQAGGVGVDLTRARYAVYFSLGFSLGDYEQSLARLHRPGQSRHVHYYHLIASGTVDEAVYGALRNRKQVVESVLSVLKR